MLGAQKNHLNETVLLCTPNIYVLVKNNLHIQSLILRIVSGVVVDVEEQESNKSFHLLGAIKK